MNKKKIFYLSLAIISLIIIVFSLTPTSKEDLENKPFSWDNVSLYFVMTDRFYDGDKSNNNSYGRVSIDDKGSTVGTFHGGDIKGLTKKLKEGYFDDLGINAIWITSPVEQIHGFVSGDAQNSFDHYGYHGYYALDWTSIDKNIGTVAEMREFVDLAHSKGIRIVLDVVINHTGYANKVDMADYNYGEGKWDNWWGKDWIRIDLPGYDKGGTDDITMNLSGLPDIKTESTKGVDIAPILKTKWAKDLKENNDSWVIPAAKKYRENLNIPPAEYIINWLSAWVEEFGIDGFRCDTAKHIEVEHWKNLKTKCNEALNNWRNNNPNSPGAQWTEDFWMTGEVFGQGLEKNYYYDNGFDSIINFKFPKGDSLDSLEKIYSEYSEKINSDPNFNVLSYISSHDTGMTRGNMINLGSKLLLAPGGIEIYYGDETNRRPSTNTITTATDQPSRSDMNWNDIDEEVLSHWQKLGQFRRNHIAIGAGEHKLIQNSPYAFSRIYKTENYEDKVVIIPYAEEEVTIDVSSIFEEGAEVRDFYSGKKSKVKNGSVTFKPSKNNIILIELIEKI